MSQLHTHIDDKLRSFIEQQQMFFVGTAPLKANGHVNLSPKGMNSFRILGEKTVAYMDYFGSGIETVAHLRENGRIVICFCSFEGHPNILRLHGTGRAVERCDAEWEKLAPNFPVERGVRAIIVAEITRISDSCGYGVPLYTFNGQRKQRQQSIGARSDEQLCQSIERYNLKSIDGLPGLRDPKGVLSAK